jgi:hypothetical protein
MKEKVKRKVIIAPSPTIHHRYRYHTHCTTVCVCGGSGNWDLGLGWDWDWWDWECGKSVIRDPGVVQQPAAAGQSQVAVVVSCSAPLPLSL